MSVISITNTFVNGTPADADKVNENLVDITDVVNGNLDDDNIDSVSESKVVFNGSGHDHSGGTSGAEIAAAGLPLAANNGVRGATFFKSGTSASIAHNTSGHITFGAAFNQIPLVTVYAIDGVHNNNFGFGRANDVGESGYNLIDVTKDDFYIFNFLGNAYTFYWVAIGI